MVVGFFFFFGADRNCLLSRIVLTNDRFVKAVLSLCGAPHTNTSTSCRSQWEFRLKLDKDLAHKA